MTENRKALNWYLLLAFGPAWALFLAPMALSAPGSTARQVASMVCWTAAMWSPGLAALLVRRWIEG